MTSGNKINFLSLAIIGILAFTPVVQATQDTISDKTEATSFLSQVLHDSQNPLIQQFAQDSLSKLQNPAPEASKHHVEVPILTGLKNSLAVQMIFDHHTLGVFAVDTGATYTVITPDFAEKLGIKITDETPRMVLVTANGAVNAPVVTLNHLGLGDIELNNVQAIVQPLGKNDVICGLLGLNFFKNIDLSIHQDRLILETSSVF